MDPITIAAARHALALAFPAAFEPPRSGRRKRPLKIGITRELYDRVLGEDGQPLSRTKIRAAVADYCRGKRYHEAAAAGGARIDLQGEPAGEITEAERAYHETQLRRFRDRPARAAKEVAHGR